MNTAMRSILLAVTGLVSWHLAAAEQPSTRKVALNINAPSLARALIQFTEQTGLQMVFSAQGQVKDLPARPLTGTYTPQAALDRLLENSGLRYEYIDSKTVAIRAIEAGPKETAAVDQDPAGQMRLAAARVEEKDSTEVRAGETTMVNVKGKRDRTFAVNADIPRTINDAQPYYIFDRETIERSGAVNVDDFLKQRLTMNATVVTNSEQSSIGDYKGTTSNINLRGLGTDKTLVLVNGRRRPGVTSYSGSVEENQGDLAGIPVGSIDRIEVLPASASGIYGGSAIGGVVNVILREDYAGGEARVGYDNSFDSDNPRRSASLDYGFTLEGGRTHLNFSAAWSDQTPMYLNDRVDIFDRYVARILANSPNFFTVSPIPGLLGDLPYLGSLPNIVPSSSAGLLTLHGPDRTSAADNIPLNSRNTFVPAGTSSATSLAELRAGLLANAGRINMENPSTSQYPNGLQRPFHQPTESRSLRFSARRNLTPTWELYADLMYSENNIRSVYAVGNTLSVSAARPINPFTTSVIVSIPDALRMPYINESTNRSVTVGTIVHLPREWMTAFDYTYSDNKSYHFSNSARDNAAINGDLQSGALNPFVDLLRYPLDLAKYYAPSTFNGGMRLHDFALRGSGPLPALPWGQPRVTLGLEHRIRSVLEGRESEIYPITTTNNLNITTFAKDSMVNAAYMEAQVPLVRDSVLPLVHSLDLQLAGRVERYTQDTGTTSRYRYPNMIPPVEFFQGPTTPNGEPFS